MIYKAFEGLMKFGENMLKSPIRRIEETSNDGTNHDKINQYI